MLFKKMQSVTYMIFHDLLDSGHVVFRLVERQVPRAKEMSTKGWNKYKQTADY